MVFLRNFVKAVGQVHGGPSCRPSESSLAGRNSPLSLGAAPFLLLQFFPPTLGCLRRKSFYAAAPLSLCTSYALKAFNFAADQMAQLSVEGQEMLGLPSLIHGDVSSL